MKKLIYTIALSVAIAGVGAEVYLLKKKGEAPVVNVIMQPAGLGKFGTVPAFTLTDRDGSKITADDLKGKVWLANFIYTTCPDTCPALSRRLANLQQTALEAGATGGGDAVRLVSFSVDPDHDTPEILTKYADALGATKRWHFLSGPAAQLTRVAREGFLVGFEKVPGVSTEINHSLKIALVDRQGVVRRYYDGVGETDESAQIIEDLKTVLKETTH